MASFCLFLGELIDLSNIDVLIIGLIKSLRIKCRIMGEKISKKTGKYSVKCLGNIIFKIIINTGDW